MIRLDWNPVAHHCPIPNNWSGLGWVAGFVGGACLVRRWARGTGIAREAVENLSLWILLGAFAGARLYYIAHNDPGFYLTHLLHIVAVWEGGLAFFLAVAIPTFVTVYARVERRQMFSP